MDKLTSQCQELYYGLTPRAVRARSMMLAADGVIVAYFVGIIVYGITQAKSASSEEYFLGGRSLTWPVVGISLFAANAI